MDKERKAKNRKRTTSYNSEGSSISGSSSEGEAASTSDLGLIMSKLLRTTTTTDQPVLAKRKAVERQLEEEKLEKRARALVRQELWERRDSAHVVPNMESANYEKGLRKFATKGGNYTEVFKVSHLFSCTAI